MNSSAFITAKEIAEERTLNSELKQQGYNTIRGKVSRRFFEKKYYYKDCEEK